MEGRTMPQGEADGSRIAQTVSGFLSAQPETVT